MSQKKVKSEKVLNKKKSTMKINKVNIRKFRTIS